MTDNRFHHHPYLRAVAEEDLRYVLAKDTSYGASWKMSGGRSAWFMLKRKIDRMCEMMRRPTSNGLEEVIQHLPASPNGGYYQVKPDTMEWVRKTLVSEDIFTIIQSQPTDGSDGTVLAEVRDLRRYLMLVEAEMIARGVVADPTLPRHTVSADSLASLVDYAEAEVRIMQGQNEGYIGLRRDNPEVGRVATEGERRIHRGHGYVERAALRGNGSSGDEWAPGNPAGAERGL